MFVFTACYFIFLFRNQCAYQKSGVLGLGVGAVQWPPHIQPNSLHYVLSSSVLIVTNLHWHAYAELPCWNSTPFLSSGKLVLLFLTNK